MISTLRYFEWKNEMTSWKLVFLRFFFRHNDFSRVYKYTRVFCIRWKLSLNGIEIPFISSEFRFCAMCNSVRDIDWMQKRVRARQCCTLTLYVCIFKGFVDAHLFIKWNNVIWNRINRSSCVIYLFWKNILKIDAIYNFVHVCDFCANSAVCGFNGRSRFCYTLHGNKMQGKKWLSYIYLTCEINSRFSMQA